MQYSVDNKAIASALMYRLRVCEEVSGHYAVLCSRNYKDGLKGWNTWLNKCIGYQKEWLKVRKALSYMTQNITGNTCTHCKDGDDFINEVIRRYGKNADKEFKDYTFDCGFLVFQVLDEDIEYEFDYDWAVDIDDEIYDDDPEEFEWEETRGKMVAKKMSALEIRKSIVEIINKMEELSEKRLKDEKRKAKKKSPKKH